MTDQPTAETVDSGNEGHPVPPTEEGLHPTDAVDQRQPAYDAVYGYIRHLDRYLPPDPVHRNAVIWRAVHAALDATPVGRCISSHCVEGDHILDLDQPQTPASAPDGPQEPRTGPGRQPDHPDTPQAATDQLRADANTWRLKAIRRALTASRLRGTIDACIDLVDEPVTDRTPWGDGYRAAIGDLREVLREFGHLQLAASREWRRFGTSDLPIPDQPQEQQ